MVETFPLWPISSTISRTQALRNPSNWLLSLSTSFESARATRSNMRSGRRASFLCESGSCLWLATMSYDASMDVTHPWASVFRAEHVYEVCREIENYPPLAYLYPPVDNMNFNMESSVTAFLFPLTYKRGKLLSNSQCH